MSNESDIDWRFVLALFGSLAIIILGFYAIEAYVLIKALGCT